MTTAIRTTLGNSEHAPALAEHLSGRVKTGTYCSFTPDPLTPIEWRS